MFARILGYYNYFKKFTFIVLSQDIVINLFSSLHKFIKNIGVKCPFTIAIGLFGTYGLNKRIILSRPFFCKIYKSVKKSLIHFI